MTGPTRGSESMAVQGVTGSRWPLRVLLAVGLGILVAVLVTLWSASAAQASEDPSSATVSALDAAAAAAPDDPAAEVPDPSPAVTDDAVGPTLRMIEADEPPLEPQPEPVDPLLAPEPVGPLVAPEPVDLTPATE